MSGVLNVLSAGVPSGAPAWTPASLGSKLISWFDANNLTKTGTDVSAWTRLGGTNSGNLALQGGYTAAVYSATALDGLPGVTFTNATTPSSGYALVEPSGSAYGIFVLAKMGGNVSPRLLASRRQGAASPFVSPGVCLLIDGGSSIFGAYRGGNMAGGTLADGTVARVGSVFDGTNSRFYVNNIEGTPVANSTGFISDTLKFGGLGDSTTYAWDGVLSVIITVTGDLTSGERDSLDAYLAAWS